MSLINKVKLDLFPTQYNPLTYERRVDWRKKKNRERNFSSYIAPSQIV